MLCINRILRNRVAECATKEFAETSNIEALLGVLDKPRRRFSGFLQPHAINLARLPNSSGAGVEKLNAKCKKVTFFPINQVYYFRICT